LVFEVRTPTEFRVVPFIILLPSMVAILVEPVWWVIALVVGLLVLLVCRRRPGLGPRSTTTTGGPARSSLHRGTPLTRVRLAAVAAATAVSAS